MAMSVLMDIGDLRSQASEQRPGSAGGAPPSATLNLGGDWAELPTATELAALLPRVRVAGVRLPEPADFSALPGRTTVRIISLLRECAAIGTRVAWSLVLGEEQLGLIRQLDHLPAPGAITLPGRGPLSVDQWRSTSSFGLLYFRKGPKFLSVVDQRPESSSRTVLDDPAMMAVFLQALEGRAWAEVTRDRQSAVAARELVDRGLILRVGEHCVTLPVHMRSWPLGAALLGGTLAAAGVKKSDTDATPD